MIGQKKRFKMYYMI